MRSSGSAGLPARGLAAMAPILPRRGRYWLADSLTVRGWPVFGHDNRELAAVFAGGAIGTAARARAGHRCWCPIPARWPWATFIVNIVGAFLLGYFTTRLLERLPLSSYRRPMLGTGLVRRADDVLHDAGRDGADDRASPLRAGGRLHRGQHRRGPAGGVRRDGSGAPGAGLRAMNVAVWAGVLVIGGLGVGGAVHGRPRGGAPGGPVLPVRHADGQHQRRGAARLHHRADPEPPGRAAGRHRVRRRLHHLLDLDAGDPAAHRGTPDLARRGQHRGQRGARAAPPRWLGQWMAGLL